jgi:hypothetical protein
MRFSLIRLSDNLLLAVFKDLRIFHSGRSVPTRFELSWHQRHDHSNVLLTLSAFVPTATTVAINTCPVVATSWCCSQIESSSATL